MDMVKVLAQLTAMLSSMGSARGRSRLSRSTSGFYASTLREGRDLIKLMSFLSKAHELSNWYICRDRKSL